MPKLEFIEGVEGEVLIPQLASEAHPDGFGLRVEMDNEEGRMDDARDFLRASLERVHHFGMVHVKMPPEAVQRLHSKPLALEGGWLWRRAPDYKSNVLLPHSDGDMAEVTAFCCPKRIGPGRSTGFAPLKTAGAMMALSRDTLGAWRDAEHLPRLFEQLDATPADEVHNVMRAHHRIRYWLTKYGSGLDFEAFARVSQDRMRRDMPDGLGVGRLAVQHEWEAGDLVLSSAYSMHWRGHKDRRLGGVYYMDYRGPDHVDTGI